MSTLKFRGPPSRWIANHGKYADVLNSLEGMPSYESDQQILVVFDNLVTFMGPTTVRVQPGLASIGSAPVFIPSSYGEVALRAALLGDEGLVSLHAHQDAMWSWRPLLYRLAGNPNDGEFLTRFGSQQELHWRYGLQQVEMRKLDLAAELEDLMVKHLKLRSPWPAYKAEADTRVEEFMAEELPFYAAERKAREILLEHLSPQQRLDYEARDRFYVRGIANPLYEVRLGDGVAVVHPATKKVTLSICLHPETWIPHEDVALAIKLLIESGVQGEEEMLHGGRTTRIPARTRPRQAERVAYELERALEPSPA